jgi:hypothetical protein
MSKKQKRRSRIYLKSNRIIKPLVIDLNFIKKSIDNLTDKKRLPVFGIATPGKTTFAEALALRAFKCSMAEIIIPRTTPPPVVFDAPRLAAITHDEYPQWSQPPALPSLRDMEKNLFYWMDRAEREGHITYQPNPKPIQLVWASLECELHSQQISARGGRRDRVKVVPVVDSITADYYPDWYIKSWVNPKLLPVVRSNRAYPLADDCYYIDERQIVLNMMMRDLRERLAIYKDRY